MIGGIDGGMMWQRLTYAGGMAVQNTEALSTMRNASPETSPQTAAVRPPVSALPTAQLPYVPDGYSATELAARTRAMFPALGGTPLENVLQGRVQAAERKQLSELSGVEVEEPKSPAEVMEDAKCETCEKRKYQDGSDDPGVSFKTAQHVDPDTAQSAVRGHEQEHVTREQAEAQREGRKVVAQSVSYHTAICPECGRVYIAGGETKTVTAAKRSTFDQKSAFLLQGGSVQ